MLKKISRVLSNLLHPVLVPGMTTAVYLYALPLPLHYLQKYLVFAIVIGATFVIPLLTLFLLKHFGYVKTNDAETIEERKLPVYVMMANYLFLATVLQDIWQLRELTILAYATVTGLGVISLLFYARIKSSLHMMGISSVLGFALVYGESYTYSNLVIALVVFLMGALASARLHLKAHTVQELVIGTGLGIVSPILIAFFL